MDTEKLTQEILDKLNLDGNKLLKKKIRGLPGFSLSDLIFSLITHNTLIEAAYYLGYTDNPIKQAIRQELSKLFPHRSHGFADVTSKNLLPWRQELLKVIGRKHCFSCKNIRSINEFYSNVSRSDKISGECKYCNLASSKLRKYYIEQRTPMWVDINEIAEFYSKCPDGYHVDHIIPLQGKEVSGLHVINNLQYLPAKDNLTKSNKYFPNA